MQIGEQLQLTKCNRQVTFATHNPNLVVNGDADKIIHLTPAMDFGGEVAMAARISISADGALEAPKIRQAVINTMEGGREAFMLRQQRYGRRALTADLAS